MIHLKDVTKIYPTSVTLDPADALQRYDRGNEFAAPLLSILDTTSLF